MAAPSYSCLSSASSAKFASALLNDIILSTFCSEENRRIWRSRPAPTTRRHSATEKATTFLLRYTPCKLRTHSWSKVRHSHMRHRDSKSAEGVSHAKSECRLDTLISGFLDTKRLSWDTVPQNTWDLTMSCAALYNYSNRSQSLHVASTQQKSWNHGCRRSIPADNTPPWKWTVFRISPRTVSNKDGELFIKPDPLWSFSITDSWINQSMATMIRQTLRLDRVSVQLFNSNFFHIIGPDETVILPHAWEHMVRVGWHVRLWLLNNHKREHTCLFRFCILLNAPWLSGRTLTRNFRRNCDQRMAWRIDRSGWMPREDKVLTRNCMSGWMIARDLLAGSRTNCVLLRI